jgi:hypothetical protein
MAAGSSARTDSADSAFCVRSQLALEPACPPRKRHAFREDQSEFATSRIGRDDHVALPVPARDAEVKPALGLR